MKPTISIIIPVFKAEKYLPKCIESIINQTYQNWEIILVNDGSPDNSGEVCNKYAQNDSRIKVIHKENKGVSSARNVGLNIASGDYICFLDSDDWVEIDWCEVLYSKIKSNRLVVTGYLIEEKKRSIVTQYNDSDEMIIPKDCFYSLSSKKMLANLWNKIYIAEIIKRNKLSFNTDACLGEDLLFNLSYLHFIDDIYVVNKPLYHYRRYGEESLDNKYHENLFQNYKTLYKEILNTIEIYQKNNEQVVCNYYTSYLNALLRAMANTCHSNKSFCEKISSNYKIIRSNEFSNCLRYADLTSMNRIYATILKMKNYLLLHALNCLIKAKNSIE